MLGVYYEALAEFSLERVRDAAAHFMQTATFFPTTGEWATRCRELQYDRPGLWEAKTKVLCEVCQDTGYVYKDCEAGSRCGREACVIKNKAHTYVTRCACFTSEAS